MSKPALETLAREVESVLAGADGRQAIKLLSEECQLLKASIPEDPFAVVTADVFVTADELVVQALLLAGEFGRRGDTVHEEVAYQLRTLPILAVHSHRKHFVGPAMLDWAECNRKAGNQSKADQIYNAVVADFRGLAYIPLASSSADDLVSLESLKTALLQRTEEDSLLLQRVLDLIPT